MIKPFETALKGSIRTRFSQSEETSENITHKRRHTEQLLKDKLDF